MDHTINYQLAQARIADLRHHAQRDTLARAARRLARHRCPGLIPWELGRRRAVPGIVQAAQPAAADDTSAR
jgi:hypothetical protein